MAARSGGVYTRAASYASDGDLMGSVLGLVALYLAALAVRTSYELLKKAGRVDPGSRALSLTILLDMILLWGSWFTLCALDPARLVLPALMRQTGLAALVVGLVLAVGALTQLRGVENIDHLVTTGVFGVVRHPMSGVHPLDSWLGGVPGVRRRSRARAGGV